MAHAELMGLCLQCALIVISGIAYAYSTTSGNATSNAWSAWRYGAQMRGMADMMRQNPAMAAQMRSMMAGMDPEQFKNMVRALLSMPALMPCSS